MASWAGEAGPRQGFGAHTDVEWISAVAETGHMTTPQKLAEQAKLMESYGA